VRAKGLPWILWAGRQPGLDYLCLTAQIGKSYATDQDLSAIGATRCVARMRAKGLSSLAKCSMRTRNG
jgi:hypothetical protein